MDEMELIDHFDRARYSANSDLYCETAYCADFATEIEVPSGNEVVLGTPVASVTSDQCMDMCSCDSECAMFVWSEYDNCFDPATNSPVNCRMCRIFTVYDPSDPFVNFNGFSFGNNGVVSSVVGTKNASSLTSPFNNCNSQAACENPEIGQVDQGLSGLGLDMCISTIFNDTENGE